MQLKFAFLYFSLLLIFQQASSQCCSAGSPSSFAFGDQANPKARSLFLSSSFKYSSSSQYFKGNQPVDLNFDAPASYSYIDLSAAYGISQRFSIQAQSGYFLNKVQHNPAPYPSDRGFGLSDADFFIKYRAYKSIKHHIEVNTSAGVRVPVGVFDLEKDGVKLPLTIQPSSGSLVYLAGISSLKTFNDSKWKLYSAFSAEFPQLIDSKNFYYHYGNLYNLSVAAACQLSKYFVPALQLMMEMSGHATRELDQVVEATGYSIVALSPQVESSILNNWSARIAADIPVYRYYNGIQLANAFKISLKVSHKIGL
jgi:hypothetical protein